MSYQVEGQLGWEANQLEISRSQVPTEVISELATGLIPHAEAKSTFLVKYSE